MPIQMIRMTELLKSGIDFSAHQMKRSISLSDNNIHFFSSMQKQILEQGGRVRIGSYVASSYAKFGPENISSRDSPSNGRSTTFDAPFSPDKFLDHSFGNLNLRQTETAAASDKEGKVNINVTDVESPNEAKMSS